MPSPIKPSTSNSNKPKSSTLCDVQTSSKSRRKDAKATRLSVKLSQPDDPIQDESSQFTESRDVSYQRKRKTNSADTDDDESPDCETISSAEVFT